MNYFRINFTLSSKVRGSNEYIKNYKIKIPSDKLYIDEPKFIGNIQNEKINFEPYLLDIVLFAKSKVNDLLMDGGPVSKKLVVSDKLKYLLEKCRKSGLQFFNINVEKQDQIHKNFWILNMFEFSQEFINFKDSVIIIGKRKAEGGSIRTPLQVKNLSDFAIQVSCAIKNIEIVTIEKVKFNKVDEDFFMLQNVFGGIGYFVSETLKKEIEDAGCTGIEFQPSELSYYEWTAPGGEREKIYGKM